MASNTFEYCSLNYLNLWLAYDMGYCKALADGDRSEKLTALKNAGGFYRVARNLPSEHDEKKGIARYQPVLDIIDLLDPIQFKNNPVKKILEIERRISAHYGNGNVLALTTKFLWLKIKQPILMYDSRARIALGTEGGNLYAYCEKWREQFEASQREIVEVCSILPDLHKYVINQEIGTREYIREISTDTWFHERVFDIYLWNKGNNG